MKRREFIKYSACGLTAAGLGCLGLPGILRKDAYAASTAFNLSMEAALVEMVDTTRVFFWLFKLQGLPAPNIPGPVLFAFSGDSVTINITNNLSEVHEFRIIAAGRDRRGKQKDLNTGPIQPGQTAALSFVAPEGGTYMYVDPRNAPVNRVLGLHGAFIVLPAAARPGNAITPYSNPTPKVQQLFNDLGGPLFPGQPWAAVRPAGEPIPEPFRKALADQLLTPTEMARLTALEPFLYRTRIWLFNSVDPRFNMIAAAGGNAEPGGGIDQKVFRAAFTARYFMLNGKSGAYSSHEETAPESVLAAYIGQPHVIRILNAGMPDHSPHIHANHFYLLAVDNVVLDSAPCIDTMSLIPVERDIPFALLQGDPLGATYRLSLDGGSRMDWLVPFIRPPDIPGDPNIPLSALIPEELGTVLGNVPQSPLEYPMHGHNEPSQTAAGGNYPQGLITHFLFLGELINGVEVPFPKPI